MIRQAENACGCFTVDLWSEHSNPSVKMHFFKLLYWILIIYTYFIAMCESADNHPMEYYSSVDDSHMTASGLHFRDGEQDDQKQQEHMIRKELLSMLGLHQAPKPVRSSRTDSAPKFMLELYKQLELADVGEGFSASTEHDEDMMHYNMTSRQLGNQAGDADMIMSFINHAGKLSWHLVCLFILIRTIFHNDQRVYEIHFFWVDKKVVIICAV